ncbi:MAG: ComGF family competence protein [Kurthia sp.]|nr:ComGF family competence protein [Candidatus Kurthia equi]
MKRGVVVLPTEFKKNEGFTFVEALLQLITFMVIISSILLIFPWYEKTENSILATYSMEFEVFLSELKVDLMDASSVKVLSPSEMQILKIANEENPENHYYINYRFGNKTVKKTRATNQGTNIKLTRVKAFEFKQIGDEIVVSVTFTNKLRKERSIVF